MLWGDSALIAKKERNTCPGDITYDGRLCEHFVELFGGRTSGERDTKRSALVVLLEETL